VPKGTDTVPVRREGQFGGASDGDWLAKATQEIGDNSIPSLPSIGYAESSASGSSIPMGVGKKGYIPLDEQLMSDDIQQVYASRLHFQQKLK